MRKLVNDYLFLFFDEVVNYIVWFKVMKIINGLSKW